MVSCNEFMLHLPLYFQFFHLGESNQQSTWTGLDEIWTAIFYNHCKLGSFGVGFFLAEVQKDDFKSLPWWKPISALVAGAAVSSHGSNVINNKRTAELTALLVRSTNSASELPIAKLSEYSDLLEDSDNE